MSGGSRLIKSRLSPSLASLSFACLCVCVWLCTCRILCMQRRNQQESINDVPTTQYAVDEHTHTDKCQREEETCWPNKRDCTHINVITQARRWKDESVCLISLTRCFSLMHCNMFLFLNDLFSPAPVLISLDFFFSIVYLQLFSLSLHNICSLILSFSLQDLNCIFIFW